MWTTSHHLPLRRNKRMLSLRYNGVEILKEGLRGDTLPIRYLSILVPPQMDYLCFRPHRTHLFQIEDEMMQGSL